MQMLHLYKPPPPYPSNRISSNSTPDLAGISQHPKLHSHFVNNIVSGSSPDLVSTGNFINQHYLKQYLYANSQQHQPVHRSHSYLPPQHGTYENLSSIFRPQALIVENPNVTKHIKKVYDEHGNIIYCMPANMKQILQENALPSTGFVVTRNQNAVVAQLNDSSEPIYENIPLPWHGDKERMRARAQSVNSAPDRTLALQTHVPTAAAARGSKEYLYANVGGAKYPEIAAHAPSESNNVSSKSETSESPKTMSRTNTFIVNKSAGGVTRSGSASTGGGGERGKDTTAETITDVSSSSGGSNKSKKKRWGILMGRSKSSEKVKSATLGREKEKNKDKGQSNNRHRWSTGLPRLHPLPPSISKETMVSLFCRFYFVDAKKCFFSKALSNIVV